MKLSVKVEGLQQLRASLRTLDEETRRRIFPAMTAAGANLVKKDAINRAPQSDEPHEIGGVKIEPGNLKRNIIVAKRRKTELTAEHVVTVRAGAKAGHASRYGSMVEHGTVRMSARPWMRPALSSNIQSATEEIKRKGQERLRAAVRKFTKDKRR
jgi:HK97 gp10 family phage protein